MELSPGDNEKVGGLDRIERSEDRETEHEGQGDQGAMHGMEGQTGLAKVLVSTLEHHMSGATFTIAPLSFFV